MPGLDALTGRGAYGPGPRLAAAAPIPAKLASTAATSTARVDVLTAGARLRIEDCRFMPRGATYPSKGDPCYIARAADGSWLLVWWEPA